MNFSFYLSNPKNLNTVSLDEEIWQFIWKIKLLLRNGKNGHFGENILLLPHDTRFLFSQTISLTLSCFLSLTFILLHTHSLFTQTFSLTIFACLVHKWRHNPIYRLFNYSRYFLVLYFLKKFYNFLTWRKPMIFLNFFLDIC